jgi:hypothetical protein
MLPAVAMSSSSQASPGRYGLVVTFDEAGNLNKTHV